MCRAERVLLMIAGGVFNCLVCTVRFDETGDVHRVWLSYLDT